MITLQELLQSRDRRAARQGELLAQYPGRSLVCVTVQLPGSEKRNGNSLKIANAAVEAVEKMFMPVFKELKDLETGFECYFVVEGEPLDVKKAASAIEENHPLGRLMDIDVIGADGPIGRGEIGLEERRCLLCDKPARVCMRAGSHSTTELLDKIEKLCEAY